MPESSELPEIPSEWAEAIGYVAIAWTGLEEIMRRFVGVALGLRYSAAKAVTAELPSVALFNLAEVLVNLTGKQDLMVQSKNLHVILKDLRSKRNDAVHAHYMNIDEAVASSRVKARVHLRFLADAVTMEFLAALRVDIAIAGQMTWDLSNLFLKLGCVEALNRHFPDGLMPSPTPTSPALVKGRPRPPKQSSAQRRKAREQSGDGDGQI